MKRIVLKYGGLGAMVLAGASGIQCATRSGGEMDFAKQEIIGYATIFLSMIFVYFGMRQYRDRENGGTMTYLQGLKVGILISVLPSIVFGVFNAIYVKYLDPGFVDNYYNAAVRQMKAKLPPEEFVKQLKEMDASKEFFRNTFLSSLVMGVTVLIVGIVVSAICALILQRKNSVHLANA